MIYTNANLKFCTAFPLAAYTAWRDDLSEDGFRHISLSLAGPPGAPLYTAVMVKRDPPVRVRSFAKMSFAELVAKIAEMAAADGPLHPFIVSATGPQSTATYAAAFREMAEAPQFRPNMSAGEYREENETQRAAGRIPIWIDAHGSISNVRYCAIWAANPGGVAWNAEAVNDLEPERSQRFEAMSSVRARPQLVAMTPNGAAARLFVDSCLKDGWSSKTNMSAGGFDTALDEQAASGLLPVLINTAIIGGGVRFSAIFSRSDEILPREFRMSGPQPIGLNMADRTRASAIDAWMEGYVRHQNLRGAAIAIVAGTRLVYTKGYTFAEANYPDILPTTLFRMASIAKTYCAVAIWALLQRAGFGRGTTMQSVLNLTRDGGAPPADSDFANVTIRHLLESRSGIDQGSAKSIVSQARDDPARPSQPLSIQDVARGIAARAMPGAPGGLTQGGKHETVYGNTDYFLLSMVAARKAGRATFEDALEELVLEPLHMTRTRGSTSRIEERKSDEAMHHFTPTLETAKSVVHDDRRIVPIQYGGENYEISNGTGGLSAAVIDVARLCAMFSCRLLNPVLDTATVDSMLADAVAANGAAVGGEDAHGFHGFDSANSLDLASHQVQFEKGGANAAVKTGLIGTTGKHFAVIARNGPKVVDAGDVDWKTALLDIARDIDWGKGDLFPRFGMPSLGLRATPKPEPARPDIRQRGPA